MAGLPAEYFPIHRRRISSLNSTLSLLSDCAEEDETEEDDAEQYEYEYEQEYEEEYEEEYSVQESEEDPPPDYQTEEGYRTEVYETASEEEFGPVSSPIGY